MNMASKSDVNSFKFDDIGLEMQYAELSHTQVSRFKQDGYLMVENAVSPELLSELKRQFDQWVEDSRQHQDNFGETINGKPRFDLEPGHQADKPALRRVNAPVEISTCYHTAMCKSRVPQMIADLIGPDVKFHHSKINSKLPGAQTEVKWHQDFPFTPHTNDDLITALLMVDEVTEQNGPLKVVPGSHQGEIYSLWHDGAFSGAVTEEVAKQCESRSISCTGPAGAVCLMHTRLLHGSSPNFSKHPRTLFICVYSADDALPCAENPMPSAYEGLIVAGRTQGRVRCISYELDIPQKLESASFFHQQAQPR